MYVMNSMQCTAQWLQQQFESDARASSINWFQVSQLGRTLHDCSYAQLVEGL